MARPRKNGISRRVQIRLPSDLVSVFDGYTPDQLSEVMSIALRSITPDSGLGVCTPTLVRPQELKTFTIAKLQLHQRFIRIVFPEKRDDFRLVMIGHLFIWADWCWQRQIPEADDICDRASEVAHALLEVGFCVQIEHIEIRDRAIAASFSPEDFRRVEASGKPYEGWFMFTWPRSDDFYQKAMKISAAKYADGKVRVPPEHFREVQDFAEENNFGFTPGAIAIAQHAQAMWEAAVIVSPRKRKSKQKQESSLDDSSANIPDSLRDDD